jgi:hypothetical protein
MPCIDFGKTTEPEIISLSRLTNLLFQKISGLLNFFDGLRAKHNGAVIMINTDKHSDKTSSHISSELQKRHLNVPLFLVITSVSILIVCILLLFYCSTKMRNAKEPYYFEDERIVNTLASRTPSEAVFASVSNRGTNFQAIQPAQKPEIDPAQIQRHVVYNAVINIVVERISGSLNQIKTTVTNMGGYMQEMSSNSITLKVPAGKLQDAIAEVEKLGEVTLKDIKGTDVTEEMRDLNIRLRNAEQVRDRLIKLLDRAEKVEEALKIEKELERITETIELLKGKITYFQNKVAFSTLTIHFNSPLPQDNITTGTPFHWVHRLGCELTRPVNTQTYQSKFFSPKPVFTLPDGYIKYFQDKNLTRAMSADGVMIHLHKEKNYTGGSVKFWASLVRRVLVEQKVIHIDKKLELKIKNKNDAVLFAGHKQIGTKQHGYIIALATTKRNIYVFEAWGPLQEFDKDRSKLENAIKSMQL